MGEEKRFHSPGPKRSLPREISVACSPSCLLLNGTPCLIAKPICQPMWHPTPPAFWQSVLNYSPSPNEKHADMHGCVRMPVSGIVRIILAWFQTYYIDLSFQALQWIQTMQISSRHIRQITWAQRPALGDPRPQHQCLSLSLQLRSNQDAVLSIPSPFTANSPLQITSCVLKSLCNWVFRQLWELLTPWILRT